MAISARCLQGQRGEYAMRRGPKPNRKTASQLRRKSSELDAKMATIMLRLPSTCVRQGSNFRW
jgi:hypothetical protein